MIAFQGLSASALAAAGTLHVHVATPANVALVDLHRVFAASTAAMPQAVAEWQHVVSHVVPQRHFHVPGDVGVVTKADPFADKHEASADLQASLFIALVAQVVEWASSNHDRVFSAVPGWAPTQGCALPLERPPRHA